MNNTDYYAREHARVLSEINKDIEKLNRLRKFAEEQAGLLSTLLWGYSPYSGAIRFCVSDKGTESRHQSALRIASHFPDAQWTKARSASEGMIDWRANVSGVEVHILAAESMPGLSIDGSPVDLSAPAQ